MRTSIRFLLLASTYVLTACAGKAQPVTQNGEPVAAQPAVTSPIPAPIAPQATTAAPITDNEAGIYARLARLEADVSSMRTQMSSMGPVLEKMPALQDKLSELVTELKRIDARVASAQAHAEILPVPAAKPVAAAPKPTSLAPVELAVKPAPAKGLTIPELAPTPDVKPTKGIPLKTAATSEPAPAAVKPAQPSVTGVRLGDDASKTRIVLDLSQKLGFSYDLDNTEKILVVDLDAANWNADPAASFAKSPIVASYTTQSVDGGKYRLIMQLRAPARVLATQTLLPNGEKGDRIVIDLVKDGV